MAEKITGFDDWKDLFYKWQKDIGFEPALVKDYKFDAFYDEGTGPDIEFGDYKGRKKFAKLLDVPTQDMTWRARIVSFSAGGASRLTR